MSNAIMPERRLMVKNEYGIHARPAAKFVKMASDYKSEIWVEKDGDVVSGKSIMGMLTLEAAHGCEIVVRAEGDDAESALDALQALVDNSFEE